MTDMRLIVWTADGGAGPARLNWVGLAGLVVPAARAAAGKSTIFIDLTFVLVVSVVVRSLC